MNHPTIGPYTFGVFAQGRLTIPDMFPQPKPGRRSLIETESQVGRPHHMPTPDQIKKRTSLPQQRLTKPELDRRRKAEEEKENEAARLATMGRSSRSASKRKALASI